MDGDWETADLNGDGVVDLVGLGIHTSGAEALSVFWSSANGWSRDDVEVYGGLTDSDVDLGDFDSDGQIDIFAMLDEGQTRITRLLKRMGVGFTLFSEAESQPQQLAAGDGKIVDLENDARAEVVAMGLTEPGDISSWYLRNNSFLGTVAEDVPPAMVARYNTDTAWGDVDADGDLDAVQAGRDSDFTIVRYMNQLGEYWERNDAPPPPVDLQSSYAPGSGGYVFTWDAPGTDTDETPEAGFGYELLVLDSAGKEVLGWSHPAGPSVQGGARWRLVNLPKGVYTARVRTVDSGWRRSVPSARHETTP